ncbi:MAG: DUF1156 domain-containing protein [Sulfolobales archaeon]
MSTYLESDRFPVDDVNDASAKEKQGGGRPEFWEMVFWWTRKPLISARSIIAGLVLPEETDPYSFKHVVRLDSQKIPHRENPRVPQSLKSKLSGLRLLDPFAGFGSIPLEAVRLGVGEVVAVELLPTAYVFLKAVLELPKWAVDSGLGSSLVLDVEKWGKWVVEKLREDPDVVELYDRDTAVYIGTWEVKCGYCGRYTPLVGNWWLARVKSGSSYERIAWMEPVKTERGIEIAVRDLNKELGKSSLSSVKVEEQQVVLGRETWRVPEPNISARSEVAKCLHCGNTLPGKRDSWQVKQALKEWNEKLERYLRGEIELEELRQSPARPKLLVKATLKNKQLEFEPATHQDNEKLWRALEKFKQMWGDPDIPIEPIAKYEGRSIWVMVYGFDKWFKLFNPRQLLTLIKLVKLVREAGRRVEEEKLKQGWNKEKAHKYAEAVTTYLALALIEHARYSSMVASWNPTSWAQSKVRDSLSFRGIAMVWNYVDIPTIAEKDIMYSYLWSIRTEIEGLLYLVNVVSSSPSHVEVVLDDATVLSKLGDERFDLIVTDPPYLDDVPYAELSDFYYVWLKRALSDSDGIMLVPRFFREAFFECLDSACSRFNEVRTQWEVFASREVSASDGRARYFGLGSGVDFFKNGLVAAFRRMRDLLKDGGVLVTYYAHTSPEAWEALLEAGWRGAGLMVSRAFSIVTESEERVTARGKVTLDSSIVVVWRVSQQREELVQRVRSRALEEAARAVRDYVAGKGPRLSFNVFLESLSAVLRVYTSYSRLIPNIGVGELVRSHIFPVAVQGLVNGLGAVAGVSVSFGLESSAYIAIKAVSRPRTYASRVSRAVVDRSFASVLGAVGGVGVDRLVSQGVLKKSGDRVELLEPSGAVGIDEASLKKSLEELLLDKGVNPRNPILRTPVDVLHYLEYKALELDREKFRSLVDELRSKVVGVDEALNIARVFARVLPNNDLERVACVRVLSHLGEFGLGWSR